MEGSPSHEFHAYLERDWIRCLTDWPELATAFGLPGHNDRWTDYSAEGIAARERHLQESREEFNGFRREELSEGERFNYDLYGAGLEQAQAGLRFGFEPLPLRLGAPSNLWMPLSQMSGVHIDPSLIVDLQPRNSAAEVQDILRRLQRLPELVGQTLELLRAGLERGFSPPRAALGRVPEQLRSLLTEEPRQSALLQPLTRLPSSVPEAIGASALQQAAELYRSRLVPAYRKLEAYLTGEYLPQCRETVAASALPEGEQAYAYLVGLHTTTAKSPQEIHETGLEQVRRIHAEVQRVMQRAGFTGSFAGFAEMLRTDPRFFFREPEELLNAYRALAKLVEPELPRLFGRLPRLPYGILPVPDFSAPGTPAAYYMGGSPQAGRPGYFYANTYNLGARPKWGMEDLLLHEAVPGHHLQIALAAELEGLPSFRQNTGPTAFVEGWGLYAESLGEELGRYRDPYSKYGQLDGDLWRAIRLVVDTGMHALGWTRDAAIAFFLENSSLSRHEAEVEVDRYIVWPAQALAYKVGQLKFRELRERAEARLGARFSVRRFHDVVLGQGAIPLTLLEAQVDRWVKAELSTAAGASAAHA